MSGPKSRRRESTYSGSRRRFIRTAGITGAAGLTGVSGCLGGITGGSPTIRVLGWASFENVQDQIEEKVGTTVEITGVTSTEPMFNQWNAGQNEDFDVTMPNNNYLPRFIDADLVAPLDEDVVSNWSDIYPRYQELAAEQGGRDGEIYGVPIRFGWDSYAYDSREVPEDHEPSYSMLFEEEYEGSIGMFTQHTKAMAHTALSLGYHDAFEGPEITLSEDQIDSVKEKLQEQNPLVQAYYAAPDQIKQLLTDGDVVLGSSYRFVVAQLQMDGHEWPRIAIPEEGAMTWFEAAVVSSESDNKELAWEVVDAIIDPEVVGEWLSEVGIASTNSTVADSLPGDQGQYIDIEPEEVEDMIAYKDIANEDAWISAWEEVRA